jgi:hypothetical protein
MGRNEISRILAEVENLEAMLDHAAGIGNQPLADNILTQIEKKLDAVQPFIEAAANAKIVQRGEDFEVIRQRHAEFTTRLGAFRGGLF